MSSHSCLAQLCGGFLGPSKDLGPHLLLGATLEVPIFGLPGESRQVPSLSHGRAWESGERWEGPSS